MCIDVHLKINWYPIVCHFLYTKYKMSVEKVSRAVKIVSTKPFRAVLSFFIRNIMGTPAAAWRAGGFHRVFNRSLSNKVNMFVCIMSQPSSITSQIPSGTPEN